MQRLPSPVKKDDGDTLEAILSPKLVVEDLLALASWEPNSFRVSSVLGRVNPKPLNFPRAAHEDFQFRPQSVRKAIPGRGSGIEEGRRVYGVVYGARLLTGMGFLAKLQTGPFFGFLGWGLFFGNVDP